MALSEIACSIYVRAKRNKEVKLLFLSEDFNLQCQLFAVTDLVQRGNLKRWGHLVVALISYVCSYLILSVWVSMISIYFCSVFQCPEPGPVLRPKWLSYFIDVNLHCSNLSKNWYFMFEAPERISCMWILLRCQGLQRICWYFQVVLDFFVAVFSVTRIWNETACLIGTQPGALLQLYNWFVSCYSKNNSCLSLWRVKYQNE